jgi:uncharacterized protein (DUF983 family)
MPNSSGLKAAINARCPQCREGRLFKFKWWNIFNFAQMEDTCSECGMRYEVEPGFFYGAMYISYAFTVGIMLIGGLVIYNFFNDPDAMGYVIPITLISLALVPANFRVSRVIFIHLFSGVTYRPNK